jgi:transposase
VEGMHILHVTRDPDVGGEQWRKGIWRCPEPSCRRGTWTEDVKLAGNALDEVRRRVQQATLGRRGHKDDPLYRVRRTLLTGAPHLTDRQRARLDKWLPLGDPNSEVELTWHVYQQVRSIYTVTSPAAGRKTAEKTRRLAHGFRNFTNYRIRILLAADGTRPYRRPPTKSRSADEPTQADLRRADILAVHRLVALSRAAP